MHVSFEFDPDAAIVALGRSTMRRGPNGWYLVHVVVYPQETQKFIDGVYHGYKSSISGKPLSQDYLAERHREAHEKVEREIEAVRSLHAEKADEAVICCVASGVPFVDLDFPPVATSLSRPSIDRRSIPQLPWKRPSDYVSPDQQPSVALFRGGIDPNGIDQGELGDCWFLCAVAALAEFPSKVQQIFVHPKSSEQMEVEQRCGAYRLTINKHGWWSTIAVDDYLPMNSGGVAPIFAHHNADLRVLWVGLLEKAYAKLHGSYASITGGDAMQALQDLSGCPSMRFDSQWAEAQRSSEAADELFTTLEDYDRRNCLMTLNTPAIDETCPSSAERVEERYKEAGLAPGHAYTILRVVRIPRDDLKLLKIRNPWENDVEWSGRWSDSDAVWDRRPDIRNICQFVKADDGTFWMDWNDVRSFFIGGGVCFTRFGWHDYRCLGSWKDGHPNVCFRVRCTQPVNAYLILSQKDRRGLPVSDPDTEYAAAMISVTREKRSPGASISSTTRHEVHLNSCASIESPSAEYTFNFARDLSMAYEFQPEAGTHLVVPRTYDMNTSKAFVLGVISDTPVGKSFSVEFATLRSTCKVFQNVPVFADEEAETPECEFQYKPEGQCPRYGRGKCLSTTKDI
jgi:hypothetical protein